MLDDLVVVAPLPGVLEDRRNDTREAGRLPDLGPTQLDVALRHLRSGGTSPARNQGRADPVVPA